MNIVYCFFPKERKESWWQKKAKYYLFNSRRKVFYDIFVSGEEAKIL